MRSGSVTQSEHSILYAIKGIRQAIENAKARVITASPLYIVVPPTVGAMRPIILPIFPKNRFSGRSQPTVTRFELSGSPLTRNELTKWRSERDAILHSNLEIFRKHLVQNIADLSPLRSWMRMRVHFGRLHLIQYRKDLSESKYSFESLAQMMKDPRTAGHFNKE